nr:zinc finger matrin-type protein 3-like [Onthophagus taurus]
MDYSFQQTLTGKFNANFVIPKKIDEESNEKASEAAVLENIYSSDLYQQLYSQNYYVNYQPVEATQSGQKRTWEMANYLQPTQSLVRTLGSSYDATFPVELLALFQPLFCKLCSVQFSSNVVAKTHYDSKNHDKKLRKYLVEYSERTGEPLHKKASMPRTQKEEEYDPKYFHCSVCDLPLTGKIHAESHYMGKNHQKVVLGKKAPAGKGYYNTEGKWVRVLDTKQQEILGDGFGVAFRNPQDNKVIIENNSLRCSICNVSVTSQPQLEMHLQGQKHMKKLKSLANGIVTAGPEVATGHLPHIEVIPTNPEDILSAYRTPSGQFYCKTCNISLNSEVQFTQHLNSKKHLKKNAKE